jgi:hypothetical protein
MKNPMGPRRGEHWTLTFGPLEHASDGTGEIFAWYTGDDAEGRERGRPVGRIEVAMDDTGEEVFSFTAIGSEIDDREFEVDQCGSESKALAAAKRHFAVTYLGKGYKEHWVKTDKSKKWYASNPARPAPPHDPELPTVGPMHRRRTQIIEDEHGNNWKHECFRKLVMGGRWKSKIEEATGLELSNELGKGAFGCAFKTQHEDQVLKVTYDDSEAINQAYFGTMQSKRGPDRDKYRLGFAIVFGVVKLVLTKEEHEEAFTVGAFPSKHSKDSNLYAISREEVLPLKTAMEKYEYKVTDRIHQEIGSLGDIALDGRDFIRFAGVKLKKSEKWQEKDHNDRMKANVKLIRKKFSEAISRFAFLKNVAVAMSALFEATGVVLYDLHAGNFGVRIHEQMADPDDAEVGLQDIVIHDPGYTDTTQKPKIGTVANPGGGKVTLPVFAPYGTERS